VNRHGRRATPGGSTRSHVRLAPRSNLATYTGLLTWAQAVCGHAGCGKLRRSPAISFSVARGRCETCAGEGFVMVELLFLPSVVRLARPAARLAEHSVTYRGRILPGPWA
jgi:hypothetical protein